MPLRPTKGNMYNWVTHTWNPIKGACPHDCSYCYMKRWGKLNPPHLDAREMKTDLGSGNYIFVGSSIDIFAEGIPIDWQFKVFIHCSEFDNHYLFQTKNPKGFELLTAMELPDITYCITLESNLPYPDIMRNAPKPLDRLYDFINLPMRGRNIKKMVTIEPIMDFNLTVFVRMIRDINPAVVNIGADSGHNNLPEPPKEKILALIHNLQTFTEVRLKKNLNRLLK